MPPVLSLPRKLVSALLRGARRRKALTGLVLAGVLGTAALVLVTRNSPSQTTYTSHDGSYKVTVTHFPDGSKQEVREGNSAGGAP
jgi:hypothetical protein